MRKHRERVGDGVARRSLLRRVGIGSLAGFAAMMTGKKALAAENPYSFWVHGNAARVQFPDRLESVEYRRTAAVFKGKPGTENWFHLPISAPVYIRIGRPTLFGANLSLKASDGVFLREARLLDGETELGSTTGLSGTGEVFQRIDIANPAYFAGLGISARIEFSPSSTVSEVHIIAAGVDLLVGE